MVAITGAARVGTSVGNATLYTTTFPCHECTRNIIAAGIARVVYLEPYTKSKGGELQADAVAIIAQTGEQIGRLKIEAFSGLNITRRPDLFSWIDRKVDDVRRSQSQPIQLDGEAVVWKARDSVLRKSI